jgi:Histone H1-like protein Hc1
MLMSLKNSHKLDSLDKIVDYMSRLLSEITTDLEKSNKGNKAASQRVRTGTVKLEKVAKAYRKESILHEKALHAKAKKSRKAPAAKAKAHAKPAAKTAAKSHAKSHAKAAPAKAKAHASHAKHPVKTQKAAVKGKAFAVKKPTAKLPKRHH